MSKSITKTSVAVVISLIALVSTSCGASKVAQCSSFDKVAKEIETATKVFDSPDMQNPDKMAPMFSRAEAKAQELSNAFQSLDLQDQRLKGFQSDFAAIYQGYSRVRP